MKIALFVENQLHYWNHGWVHNNCKRQYDVSVFDPELGVHCCELRASYEMWPAYATYVLSDLVKDPDDPHLTEMIEEELSVCFNDDVRYYHCSTIDAAPHFKYNELPALEKLPESFVIEIEGDFDYERVDEHIEDLRANPVL